MHAFMFPHVCGHLLASVCVCACIHVCGFGHMCGLCGGMIGGEGAGFFIFNLSENYNKIQGWNFPSQPGGLDAHFPFISNRNRRWNFQDHQWELGT